MTFTYESKRERRARIQRRVGIIAICTMPFWWMVALAVGLVCMNANPNLMMAGFAGAFTFITPYLFAFIITRAVTEEL